VRWKGIEPFENGRVSTLKIISPHTFQFLNLDSALVFAIQLPIPIIFIISGWINYFLSEVIGFEPIVGI